MKFPVSHEENSVKDYWKEKSNQEKALLPAA